ncbi:protein PBDC1-like protein [Dinothrombium tinctorium]|uniref:Protein PBDC1-like protein n=1 Tax=Dinothrombium tinctorium TaxID=1965070 RepID=A0A3S4Q938_9ACAR|nr:protein PBDC1-like protein [Dinothrombium tinctorium]
MTNVPTLSSILNRPAEEFVNDPDVERLWAIKAVEQMTVYFNLIKSVPTKELRLTPNDDLIYTKFREQFPDFNVQIIDIEALKSDEAKAKWRPFCNQFENLVQDFNFATFVRLDCSSNYDENNSCIVPRIQFLAIEVARNREGYNEMLKQKFNNLNKQNGQS